MKPDRIHAPESGPEPEWLARLEGHRSSVGSLLLEILVVLVALGCILAGAKPLIRGGTAGAAQLDLMQVIAERVSPPTPELPALERADASGPLARLGRALKVSIGQYEAVTEMFGRGRLSCAQLRDAYVEVSDGWTAYSVELARQRRDLSAGLVYRDETLYESVQLVDTDFSASGCSRP